MRGQGGERDGRGGGGGRRGAIARVEHCSRGRPGRRSDMKKAMVTLAEGQTIELMGA